MAVIEITPIVNNCCVQCCKEEQTKWGLPLLGNNGIMASEHRRMGYNPIIWVETDGMGYLAWVELGNRIG
ncbi:uncharacterized protein Bfra_011414 [Botrytis fragariae]|uniref:Uncharacterized protein n=1 Tax=Botrytis fragariae TaxID=1964551 RepID=A0A8H6AY40_9HELO|nr:uncharacterized protein Bfra_011414 [Botrytis fragariae]KAF5875652.1 hypothetical protein Bfra_011414 [Botrytis fragariae]